MREWGYNRTDLMDSAAEFFGVELPELMQHRNPGE